MRLIADPAVTGNVHVVEAQGALRLRTHDAQLPLAGNPNLSADGLQRRRWLRGVAPWRSEPRPPDDFPNFFPSTSPANGAWRRRRYESLYPATGEPIARLRAASLADVDGAIERAHHAFLTSGWAQMLPHQRAGVLHRVAQLIREQSERWPEAASTTASRSAKRATWWPAPPAPSSPPRSRRSRTRSPAPLRDDERARADGRGRGDHALELADRQRSAKLAPALAAGNAVVVKPAEVTLMALELARICEEAGVPKASSACCRQGLGDQRRHHQAPAGQACPSPVAPPRTGTSPISQPTDAGLAELGGKSPTMVLEDADLDHAVAGVLYGIFSSSGESCIAGSRLFVARSIYDEFLTRLAEGANALRVGDPAAEDTQVGPLITARHREGIERYVERIEKKAPHPHRRRAPARQRPDRATTRRRSSCGLATAPAPARKRSRAGAVAMPSTTRKRRSSRPTTASTRWPPASGAAISPRLAARPRGAGGHSRANTYVLSGLTPFGGWRDSGPGERRAARHLPVHGAEEHVLGHQRAAAAVGQLKGQRS